MREMETVFTQHLFVVLTRRFGAQMCLPLKDISTEIKVGA